MLTTNVSQDFQGKALRQQSMQGHLDFSQIICLVLKGFKAPAAIAKKTRKTRVSEVTPKVERHKENPRPTPKSPKAHDILADKVNFKGNIFYACKRASEV